MTVRMVEKNGVKTMERDPVEGYKMARRSGNLAQAVLYLSEIREEDWCPWLAKKLCEENPVGYTEATCLCCLAYVRRPTDVDSLVKWTVQLIGEKYQEQVENSVDRLVREAKGNTDEKKVRILGSALQLNSSWKWEHIPDLEVPQSYIERQLVQRYMDSLSMADMAKSFLGPFVEPVVFEIDIACPDCGHKPMKGSKTLMGGKYSGWVMCDGCNLKQRTMPFLARTLIQVEPLPGNVEPVFFNTLDGGGEDETTD